MNRRTMLKSILAVPFLPKLLCGQTKESINSGVINPNYENTMAMCGTAHRIELVYCCNNDTLYEGQYVIYTPSVAWIPEDITHVWKVICKAKSWKDIVQSIKDNTFAGVVRKQRQCPGFVEIYAFNEKKANGNNKPATV